MRLKKIKVKPKDEFKSDSPYTITDKTTPKAKIHFKPKKRTTELMDVENINYSYDIKPVEKPEPKKIKLKLKPMKEEKTQEGRLFGEEAPQQKDMEGGVEIPEVE